MSVDRTITVGSGGRRVGSGRKPVNDKKIQCYAFIPGSIVEKLGGKQRVQFLMTQFITGNYEDLLPDQS